MKKKFNHKWEYCHSCLRSGLHTCCQEACDFSAVVVLTSVATRHFESSDAIEIYAEALKQDRS